MDPNFPVQNLPGVGTYFQAKLKRLDIYTLEDLIYHFPARYDDFSKMQSIRNLTPGEKISLQGVIWEIRNVRTRTGKFITVAIVADESGTLEVIWFNQPYLTKTLKAGLPISLSGKVDTAGYKPKLISPSYEIIENDKLSKEANPQTLHTGRLVPVYPETEGVSSKWIRAKIAKFLPDYLKLQKEFLPEAIVDQEKLSGFSEALSKIHFPKDYEEVEKARTRLAFDEIFLIQVASKIRKKAWQEKRKAYQMKIPKVKVEEFINNLPFTLTSAQKKASDEILKDLNNKTAANRLLQGDVGSGKTVVAAIAAYATFLNGLESLVAAPTEILAFQHQKTLDEILSPYKITVGIWTSSRKIKGEVTCGTHALLTSFKSDKKIGLVVVDEQHRFGVAQRAKMFLKQSKNFTPHLLTMTATPIPRTLALTLYQDLDMSILDEMPKGRQKIDTFTVPNKKRGDAYKFIEKQIKKGRQAFIITPFIEPSESITTVKAAKDEFRKVKNFFSKSLKFGLLHGKLKSKEKEDVINLFKNGETDILVSTPVVEVGIDVPNATIMMIESSERFGLAQLHQLRGRVGRSSHKSYCLLFTDSQSWATVKRLKSMEKIQIGAELAQIDLAIRGPGELFGLKQSGFASLKIANISDQKLISTCQNYAQTLLERDPQLQNYPTLLNKIRKVESEYSQPN